MASKPFSIDISDFSGGLNTLDAPYQIQDNQSSRLENFDIIGRGALQKRYGYDIVVKGTGTGIRGLIAYTTSTSPSSKFLIYFQGGNVFTITPANSTPINRGAYGVDDGTRVNGSVYKGVAFFGNGNVGNVPKQFDGTAVTSLAGSPPNGSIFAAHASMGFISGVKAGNTFLHWSDYNTVNSWVTGVGSTAGNLGIREGDGDPIMAVVMHGNNIVIFKQNEKWGLSPISDVNAKTTGFSVAQIMDRSDGTLSGNSLGLHTDGIFFYGRNGFQKYGIVPRMPDGRVPTNISYAISPTIKQVKRVNAWRGTGIVYDNKYICSLPVFGNTNDVTFVLSTIYGGWTTYTGMPASGYAVFEDALGEESLYFSGENSASIFKINKKFIDSYDPATGDGQPINAYWQSKTYRPSFKTAFDRVIIVGQITNPASVRIGLNVDRVVFTDTITEADIVGGSSTGSGTGSSYTGLGYTGGSGIATGGEPMFDFIKEIHFPSEMRTGRDLFVTCESVNLSEGIRIENISISGTIEDQSVIR